jgi:hypothetical protein
MPKRFAPYALLFLILLGMLPLKAQFDPDIGRGVYDGNYYYGIARLISEGQGLQTNLSLYHQGLKEFPHQVTSSPIWPLALGSIGSAFGMRQSATSLPEFLYFFDLILLYFVGLRMWRGVAGDDDGWLFRRGGVFDFGHFGVLVLATNVVFFRFSSVPNNDAMGFGVLFAGLLALERAATRDDARFALLAGLLAGLALLTRAQMLGLAVAVPIVLAWVALGRGGLLRMAGASLVGTLVSLIPWVLYLMTWKHPVMLTDVLGLETQRETPEVAAFAHTFDQLSGWPYVVDRAGGFLVAFDWREKFSYFYHFATLAYAVPIGMVFALIALVRRHLRIPLRLDPQLALCVCMLGTGIIMLIPVHLHHATFANEWLFGYRHGIPLLLLILPAVAYLDRFSGLVGRIVLTLLLASALVLNGMAMTKLLNKNYSKGLPPVEHQLVRWLDAQSPRPTSISTKAFRLSAFSQTGFHWIRCERPHTETLALLQHANADYVIVRRAERKCPFILRLGQQLEVAKAFGKGELLVLELADPRGGRAAPGQRRGDGRLSAPR